MQSEIPIVAAAVFGAASWVSGFVIGRLLRKRGERHYTMTYKQGSRYQVDWDKLGAPLQYDPVMLTCGGCGRTVYAPDGFTPEPHGCDAKDLKES